MIFVSEIDGPPFRFQTKPFSVTSDPPLCINSAFNRSVRLFVSKLLIGLVNTIGIVLDMSGGVKNEYSFPYVIPALCLA